MRTLTVFLIAMLAPVAGAQATGAVQRDSGGPQIIVSGEGKASLPPDEVIVQLAVETRAKTASRAGSDNADRMTAVRKALLALGLQENEISTAYYNIRMEMMGPSGRDTNYVATNSVQVDTRKLNLVSRIIDASLQAGANNISMVQYTLSDTRDPMRRALANAVEDARLQAEALAAAAGGRLGPLLEMNAQSQRVIPYMEAQGVMMARAAVETPISARDVTVRASVAVRWRFLPGK
jgi:hypothetical protein